MRIASPFYRNVVTWARQLARCAAVGLLMCASYAQSWQTVLDYQYAPGRSADGTGLATDPTGTIIYAAGYAEDASSFWHALALTSSDAGTTWSKMDDYVSPDNPGYDAGITVDVHGNIYVAGESAPPGSPTSGSGNHWLVRRSLDGGLTWATIDDVALGGGPSALTTDAAGNLYLAGTGWINNTRAWLVRKGAVGNGGLTWANVDTLLNANGYSVVATPTALFVGGRVQGKGGSTLWTIRRSTNGGASWNTVDSFSLATGQNSDANALAADASGIYSAGLAAKSVKGKTVFDWIVRRSTDGGNSWTTFDDAGPAWANAIGTDSQGNHYAAGLGSAGWTVRENLANTTTWSNVDVFPTISSAQPVALKGDASGHVFVAGYADDAGQIDHWIIRKH